MIKSNRGQLSIFMGVTLILIMGMLAFIVNVGLFVKAKINLQNAVDAAAFSGAATQSRQLTNIAYLNWEMRNTYKEWMFKYYVLGQLSLATKNFAHQNLTCSSDKSNFLLETVNANVAGSDAGYDKFNIPSICINNKAVTTICPIYSLPGVPRFPAIGVAGITEVFESLVTELVEQKAKDCSWRSKLNYLAATSWAFSSGIAPIPDAPQIAADRPGAWLESIELSFRMRNLEMIVNRPPVSDMTIESIQALANQSDSIGLNERPIKAFMSAFRNLSGGRYKDSGNNDELSATFKLSEIKPQPYDAVAGTVSNFLIPQNTGYSDGTSYTQKHYLDLQAVPINLATFYTTYVADTKTLNTSSAGAVQAEGACLSSKTALPVPGYIIGFNKNPEVLTYYAVKGEAEFTGLFFPQSGNGEARSIKLTAYAAAKPFGGRIGPRLFDFRNNGESIVPRADENARTLPYVSSVSFSLGSQIAGSFKPGMPIPSDQNFWISNSSTAYLGGASKSGSISYGIPNMIYDAHSYSDLEEQNASGTNASVQIIRDRISANGCAEDEYGLHNKFQLNQLSKNLTGVASNLGNITQQDLTDAIHSARQVTRYDAANYLIPDFNRGNSGGKLPNSPAIVSRDNLISGTRVNAHQYQLFAPLMGENLLYRNSNAIEEIIKNYIQSNRDSVDAYLKSIYEVAFSITQLKSAGTATDLIDSARSIHSGVDPNNANGNYIPAALVGADPADPTCKHDLASKYYHFFTADYVACGNVPLQKMVTDYIDKKNSAPNGPSHYTTSYVNNLTQSETMSAYYPSTRQGTNQEGDAVNPIGVNPTGSTGYSTRRNFYSTKFIQLSKLFNDSPTSNNFSNGTLRESKKPSPDDLQGNSIKNIINRNENGLAGGYFSDF